MCYLVISLPQLRYLKIILWTLNVQQIHFLYFKEISETETLRLLHGLSATKASGMDQFSTRILKIASHMIVPSLTSIFNHSSRTEYFQLIGSPQG